MKENLLMKIAVILVGVVLVVIMFKSKGSKITSVSVNKNSSTQEASNQTGSTSKTSGTPSVKVTAISGMKTSLGGIFAEKGNYQCDYEQVSPQSRSSNIVYLSDGKMRGEFRTITANGSTSTIFVYNGSYLYVWTEGMSTGKVSQPKTLADLPALIPQEILSGRVLGSGLNVASWNCHAWSKNSAMLEKPTYVKFN